MNTELTPKWQWYHDTFGPSEVHLHGFHRLLFQKATSYQMLEIIESPVFGRMLLLDGDVQSAERDEYIYHEALVHPALLLHPAPSRVLVIGGSEGATLREVLRHRSVRSVEMFDLDADVIETCKTYLPEWSAGAFHDPRVQLHLGDARQLLAATEQRYDVILSDLTDPFAGGPSVRLFTQEFFALVQQRLAPQGIFALQASLLRQSSLEVHRAIRNTLRSVFTRVDSYAAYVPAFDTPWGFALCSEGVDPSAHSPAAIDHQIAENLVGELKYLDGRCFQALFGLSKDINAALNQPTIIITDSTGLNLPGKGDAG
jgi:spermidine synthase